MSLIHVQITQIFIKIFLLSNLTNKLSDLFEINMKNIQINNVTNCASNDTVFVNFSIRAQHYTSVVKFNWKIQDLNTILIKSNNLTINVFDQNYTLNQSNEDCCSVK